MKKYKSAGMKISLAQLNKLPRTLRVQMLIHGDLVHIQEQESKIKLNGSQAIV